MILPILINCLSEVFDQYTCTKWIFNDQILNQETHKIYFLAVQENFVTFKKNFDANFFFDFLKHICYKQCEKLCKVQK